MQGKYLSMYLCFLGHYVCKTCTCTLENVCYPSLEQVCTDVFYDCVIFVILKEEQEQEKEAVEEENKNKQKQHTKTLKELIFSDLARGK